eukprot:8277586-Pyramimonas_sp.AAC.1
MSLCRAVCRSQPVPSALDTLVRRKVIIFRLCFGLSEPRGRSLFLSPWSSRSSRRNPCRGFKRVSR